MFKHLLVPLDGSELSEKALATARLALGSEGTLTLLNVVDIPDPNLVLLYDMPVIPAYEDHHKLVARAQSNARDYLQQLAQRMQLPPTITVHTEVYLGNPTSVIVERAQALHVDAIVMSTHGRSGFSRWMYGSVTQRVLALMPCPVLIVPGQSSSPSQPTPSDAVTEAGY
jgi:nucleotide-binding universal stress UspA family protein